MALIDDVKQICDRLAPLGWGALLQWHGLNIAAADLAGELERPLTGIRREIAGFARLSRRCDPRSRTGGSGASLLQTCFSLDGISPWARMRAAHFIPPMVWAGRHLILTQGEDQAASDLRVTPSMTC
jgi:hypothetical protein